eukprot:CAMPEP_0176025362 /NCGR_PEP_ID=MMETSP0120_2-20121206/12406_1 /TAXON_ID=160619 /ORGANISM="Kryptoperidinium foliaceum, Strain CCMP 1326" /LENGTH=452 /DNA_ID=CAMNT_0017358545 /DNA_START=130 /DNA_END=1488 /DNA_ORIENTATION=+
MADVPGFTALCACAEDSGNLPLEDDDEDAEEQEDEPREVRPPDRPRKGMVTYSADALLPLKGPVVREGRLLHLCPDDGKSFSQVTLSLYPNGLRIQDVESAAPPISLAWSPFSLVQACRLHSMQADAAQPMMRLFKVSIFHHGLTHFFACQGPKADMERARWVADVSRVLRVLTQSLFPPYSIAVDPVPGASWTVTRLMAGYLMLYDEVGVSLVYGELHAHRDNCSAFAAYEDDCCDVPVVQLDIDVNTLISERVGVDCSCFSLGDHHFSARSCAEKMLWLRAISNVKVKLRHWATNPSRRDLLHYRDSIREQTRTLPRHDPAALDGPLLPRRPGLAMAASERTSESSGLPCGSGAATSGGPPSTDGSAPPTAGPQGPNVAKGATPIMAAAAARLQAMPRWHDVSSDNQGRSGDGPPPPPEVVDTEPPPPPPLPPLARAAELAPPPVAEPSR